MHNNDNLIRINTRSEEEFKDLSRKGGLASVEAKRKRKTLKEQLLLMLEDEKIQKELSVALIIRAKKHAEKTGNAGNEAYKIIRDTIGEKPIDKQEVTNITTIIKDDVTE